MSQCNDGEAALKKEHGQRNGNHVLGRNECSGNQMKSNMEHEMDEGGLGWVVLWSHRGDGGYMKYGFALCAWVKCIQGFFEVQVSAHLGWTITPRHHVGSGIVASCTKNMQTNARQEEFTPDSYAVREKLREIYWYECMSQCRTLSANILAVFHDCPVLRIHPFIGFQNPLGKLWPKP